MCSPSWRRTRSTRGRAARAAALAFLDVYAKERETVVRNLEAYQAALERVAAACPYLELRNHGFIATFRKREDRFRALWAGKAVALAYDDGVILRSTNFGQSVLVKPPILIDPATSATMAERLESAFTRAAEETEDPGISVAEVRSRLNGGRREQPQPATAYFGDLLASIDPAYEARPRTNAEIEELTRKLPRSGVWVTRAFAPAPDRLEYDPVSGTKVPALQLSPELTPERLGDRATLMTALDAAERGADQVRAAGGLDDYRAQAFAMLTSAKARTMFDLDREPPAVRDAALGLGLGGVGYYPRQGIVHLDTGPVRRWQVG
jgi:hypothetical protein